MKNVLLKASVVSAGIAVGSLVVNLQPASATGFYGDYEPTYWNVYNLDIDQSTTPPTPSPATYTNGGVDFTNAPSSVVLYGGNRYNVPAPDDNGDGYPGVAGATYFETQLASDGYVFFNWNYGTFDTRQFDPFVVVINGVLYSTLASVDGQQGRFVSPFLSQGDVFGFSILTYDNAGGIGYAQISDFGVSSNPEAVPTPALLPGLIGMGVAALRKKRQENQEISA
ncbi:MAG: PTPA-CTERM sorting domain-containing protein [Nodosilinea sp.]